MPRSNRPRGRKADSVDEDQFSLDHLTSGWRRTELRGGAVWNVQPVSASQAVKTYACPGCTREIVPAVAHVVVWRADGVLGDAADLASRRHWHTHCWKVG